jgi:ATP-dependent DNA helicase RecG
LRRDIPEYPEEAIREAIVNALAHRDYSPFARGSYVQVRLFADRLEIQSPGGLYGNVTEESLEDEQSTRNRILMRLMEDARLVENRGSGIQAMLAAMRGANLEPPRFQDKRSSFWVAFHNHTLMSPDAVAWLNQFAGRALNDHQRLALAYLRLHNHLTSGEYQRLNHVDAFLAGKELRGLTQAELTEQHRSRRWAYYTLAVPVEVVKVEPTNEETRILGYVREHGSIGNEECRSLLAVTRNRAWYLLRRMAASGKLRRRGEKKSARYIAPQ